MYTDDDVLVCLFYEHELKMCSDVALIICHINRHFRLTRVVLGDIHGPVVACWVTDHYHSCSNLGVGISEGCFISASLSLDVARPI